MKIFLWSILLFITLPYSLAFGAASESSGSLNMIDSGLGIAALVLFTLAYALVIAEEYIHMRKSKPVIFAAGLIWIFVAIIGKQVENGQEIIKHALDHNLLEYSALLLFLLTAMIYVNALTERNVFEALRS
ncbi:MAG: sodium:proton antiporter, partial [Pseudomonadales bacterium]|nr:sodium:proton antiporter [Pseudomonadales bacterium]